MKIALFTHHFLEPTHHAIAHIINEMHNCGFYVFSKNFTDERHFSLLNIKERNFYVKGILHLDPFKFDLVHAIFDGKTALRAGAIAGSAGLPFVLSFHGGFDTQAKIFDHRYMGKTRDLAQTADAVTVICPSDVIRLRKIGVTRSIDIIPVPIKISAIPESNEKKEYHLLSVGRFISKKGIDIALSALSILPKRYTLTVVGDGPLRTEFYELSKRMGIKDRVEWTGLLSLNEMLTKMKSAFALLHPARVALDKNAEGNPQTILWAQAMGLPVISTPTGSIVDIVKHRETGIIVPPENGASVAEAVLLLEKKSELRQFIVINAKNRVSIHHSIEKVVERFKEIYGRVSLEKN